VGETRQQRRARERAEKKPTSGSKPRATVEVDLYGSTEEDGEVWWGASYGLREAGDGYGYDGTPNLQGIVDAVLEDVRDWSEDYSITTVWNVDDEGKELLPGDVQLPTRG
jgi:hypothetical protein